MVTGCVETNRNEYVLTSVLNNGIEELFRLYDMISSSGLKHLKIVPNREQFAASVVSGLGGCMEIASI